MTIMAINTIQIQKDERWVIKKIDIEIDKDYNKLVSVDAQNYR